MIRRRLNPGEQPDGRPPEQLLETFRDKLWICRDCHEQTPKRRALRIGNQALRCSRCGGILDPRKPE
jgi:hypothetical protein